MNYTSDKEKQVRSSKPESDNQKGLQPVTLELFAEELPAHHDLKLGQTTSTIATVSSLPSTLSTISTIATGGGSCLA
ncbi:MAG TPA: hypothetical protein VEF04_10685 [Blastocatellia bacterium]|nr:hypothetical protein [Blastocatellia bacterium]